MKIWVDAQLSPFIALWLNDNFGNSGINASSLRSLGMQFYTDEQIFKEAKWAGAVMRSKDYDFIRLIDIFGVPPQLI